MAFLDLPCTRVLSAHLRWWRWLAADAKLLKKLAPVTDAAVVLRKCPVLSFAIAPEENTVVTPTKERHCLKMTGRKRRKSHRSMLITLNIYQIILLCTKKLLIMMFVNNLKWNRNLTWTFYASNGRNFHNQNIQLSQSYVLLDSFNAILKNILHWLIWTYAL